MSQERSTAELSRIDEATRRVLRARHSRYLSLNRMGLSVIPRAVFSMRNLEWLDLSENELRVLPPELWELPNLKKVWLLGNPIDDLPARRELIIDRETYLRCRTKIDPNHAPALHLTQDTPAEESQFWVSELQKLGGMRRLILGATEITIGDSYPKPTQVLEDILDSLAKLEFLEGLSICGLDIGSVPPGIRKLRRLKDLDLSGLGLTSVPPWIAELEIEQLSLAANRLSTLPENIAQLRHLRRLSLLFNPLIRIPEAVWELPSLEELSIHACELREIPANILRLPKLNNLVCTDNPIESPPAEVAAKGLD